jgi:hypothetical protein
MEPRERNAGDTQQVERPQWEAPRLEVIGEVAEVVRRRRSRRGGGGGSRS